jgi:uncharacterized membrane protein (UPF0127 family)
MQGSGWKIIWIKLSLLAACLSLHSCPQDSVPPEVIQPFVEISSGNGRVLVKVEVARTAAQKQRGLMYRKHLDEDAGMLFIAPYEQTQRFWMKNTFIPLDLVFIGGNFRIKGIIEDARPESKKILSIDSPSKYVLEVNAGFCKKYGVKEGQEVKIRGIEE